MAYGGVPFTKRRRGVRLPARPPILLPDCARNVALPHQKSLALLARASDFLLCPRPLALLLCGSAVCAAAFCFLLFSPQFLAGTSVYWQAPRGLVHNSWADISTAISGYDYFVKDAWTLPLFQTTKLGVPHPANVIFTDSIPIVAMFGRLLYRVTGLTANPYGAWTALCFVASAVSMTCLVAIRGQRGIAAAIAATAAGLCMPALLERWGHMSLMAQWEIPLAFIIYFRSLSRTAGPRLIAAALSLTALALWTHTYLFVIVAGIVGAALLQAVIDRRLRLPAAMATIALFAVSIGFLIAISGYFSTGDSLDADGFGSYSLNLLSPVFPQFSALFPVLGNAMVDATGLQYEGFSYLGAGVLLLVVMTLPGLGRTIAASWRRHACMIAMLAAFALFAMSNVVYVGLWHVVTVPLPTAVLTFAGMFRASGRFVWPCMYLLTAAAIVAAPLRWGRTGGWLLLAAAVLQFVDTCPLQSALAARTSVAAHVPLAQAPWMDAISRHAMVRVVPPFGCLVDPRGQAAQTAIELQVLASRSGVATNTVYAARHQEHCTALQPASLPANELQVYLLSALPPAEASRSKPECARSRSLMICSRLLDSSHLAALAAEN